MARARPAAVLALILVAAACGSGDDDTTAPTTTQVVETTVEPSTTTAAPTSTVTTMPGRPRQTTTIPTDLGPGTARIQGSVSGPQGLVPGATVRVERLVGDDVASIDVVAADGRFTVPSIRGGSYRVRAWKAPELALTTPEVFFLAADEAKTVDLRLARVTDVSVQVDLDVERLPPSDPFTVTVTVYSGAVSDQGTVQGVSRPGLPVQVAVGAGLSLLSADRATTDASGRASFRMRCTAPGPVAADAVVDSSRISLGLPNCPG
ncbi:MAG: carboxypeptidase-like regulatory domain-containing protein [Acidimicrobiia bacterium]